MGDGIEEIRKCPVRRIAGVELSYSIMADRITKECNAAHSTAQHTLEGSLR